MQKSFKYNPDKVAASVKAAQDAKAQSIDNAQKNKDKGIRQASSMRMATDITVGLMAQGAMTDEMIKGNILHYRQWLLNNWDQ